jgi:glycosyltransferase involved in cell wall biosynthesis
MENAVGRPPARQPAFVRLWPLLWCGALVCILLRWLWAVVFGLAVWAGRLALAIVLLPARPVQTLRRAVAAVRPLLYRALKATLLRAHRQFLAYDYTARAGQVVAERTRGVDELLAPSATIVHAHDLNTLPTGVALARMLDARLVYDSHELQFGTTRATESGAVRRTLVTAWESRLARRADAAITVNESLATLMERRLRIGRPAVVRNCPEYVDAPPEPNPLLYEDLDLPSGTRIALYHGNVAAYRGLEELIAASRLLPQDVVIVMMGGGSAWDALSGSVHDLELDDRVRFHRAVPGTILRNVLASAAVGVVPIRAEVANYFYSLPNKIFELMSAGKPVAAANLPEIRALVDRHGLGTIFDPDDPADIARAIMNVLDDPAYEVRAASARAAAREHNWQAEREKLTAVYDRIAPAPAREPALVAAGTG